MDQICEKKITELIREITIIRRLKIQINLIMYKLYFSAIYLGI